MENKTLTIILIIMLSILAIAITLLMVNVMNGKFNMNNLRLFSTTSNELVVDETYNIDFNKIDISSESGDVYIKESATDEVKVLIYGKKDNTTINIVNNELVIDVKSDVCIGFCFNTNSKIEVYLPNNYANLIKIDSKYGDVEIGNFENSIIEVKEECGNVSVLSANEVTINNEYGNININKVNIANVSDSAGDIEIGTIYDAIIDNKYGNIEIENILNYIEANNDCGDIDIDNLMINKDSKITDDFGNIEIGKTNEIYIDAKTELGNVEINNNYSKSSINLIIKNNCGDIEVDN